MTEPARPRPVTAAYLRKAALHYLSGHSASADMVRQTLQRRVKRRLSVSRIAPETAALIDTAIAELLALHLIDDAKFAEIRAATLVRKGLPKRRIAQSLRAKGVAASTIESTGATDVDDLAQARRFVERKRLGHLRRGGVTPQTHAKDLRALARAGFGYAVAKGALAAAESD